MSQSSATLTEAANLAQLFLQRVEKSGDKEAFRIPENGDWTSITWKQAADRVEPLAAGLLSLGVEPEDRVGIASTTRLEWILADLAMLCAGAATTTVYPSTNGRGHRLHPRRLRVQDRLRRGRKPAREAHASSAASCPTWPRSCCSTVTPTTTG